MSDLIKQREEIISKFFQFIANNPKLNFITSRHNDYPRPYINLFQLDIQDSHTKFLEGADIRIVFVAYSDYEGVLEMLEMKEALSNCLEELYKSDERVIKSHMDFSPIRDVQRPDIKQGYYTVHIKCLYLPK